MDVRAFVAELLQALATVAEIGQVALRSEGPIVAGRAFINAEMFLEFYFNEATGTIAFALIRDRGRIWGIDRDNLRGWHLHPHENPREHRGIEPLSVSEIVACLRAVLKDQVAIPQSEIPDLDSGMAEHVQNQGGDGR